MSVPTRPVSSANTGPAHAPTRMQIAAPENQVTNASATPKKPNWASLSVTTSGIQIVAEAAYTRHRDAGDHTGREEHARADVAQEEEPRGEPPQR